MPTPLIVALVARGEELRGVELFTALTIGPVPPHGPSLDRREGDTKEMDNLSPGTAQIHGSQNTLA